MGKTGSGELVQGTLPLLILRTLAPGPNHGFAIARRIQQVSKDVLRVEEGSLYPALYRMARKGWIKGEYGVSENNRRAKYYRLTADGRKQLAEQTQGWQRLASAVSQAVLSKRAPGWAQ
jgi:PadR family transcriptional regulator, regulatory protein PadR